MPIVSINPATGEELKSFRPHTDNEVDRKISSASWRAAHWRQTPFTERALLMLKVAEILEEDAEKFGRLLTLEMGKLYRAAIDEVKKSALGCRFYAQQAPAFLADEVVDTPASKSFVRYEPLGVVLAVMPWNFPFWQVFRCAAPAIMAGNVVLLKHASNVPQCALMVEEIFARAGFPEGVFQTLLLPSDRTGRVIADDRIRAVSLTGSEGAGMEVARAAGASIKKCVLELGGSDPFIVMPSADLDDAAAVAVKARVVNNGQSCIAAKRFILHQDIAAEFTTRFLDGMKALVTGDPFEPETGVGPLATPQILKDLERQVNDTVGMGAKLLLGGKPLIGPGNFYPPTVLSEIPERSPGATEEFFGPVALLFTARDADNAAEIANGTKFGLGSSVWTTDPGEVEYFTRSLEAGSVFFNSMVASDPRLPFGGVKYSGYGRELGVHGIKEFVSAKTVWIR